MSERGVFAVDRGIWEHDVLSENEPYSRREAWLWLVSEAAWKPHKRRILGRSIELGRGQYAGSLRFIASKWRWNEARVRRFLSALISSEMIDANTDAGVTVVTVCKYDEYQRVSLPTDAMRESEVAASPTQERRKVEDKEDKEDISSLRSEGKAKRSRAKARAALPDDWILDEQDQQYASSRGFDRDRMSLMGSAFANNHRGKGALMADWHAAWRTWCDNEVKFHGAKNGNGTGQARTYQASGSPPTRDSAVIASMGRALERRRADRAATEPGREEVRGRADPAKGTDAQSGAAAGDSRACGQLTLLPKTDTGT